MEGPGNVAGPVVGRGAKIRFSMKARGNLISAWEARLGREMNRSERTEVRRVSRRETHKPCAGGER